MTKVSMLKHAFVEHIPEQIEEGVIYISVAYATAVHLCCCGCGNEVVAPLTPTDWRLEFDGESVSLHPSIGNWSFTCNSHYWIRNNRVQWARQWSSEEIAAGRAAERVVASRHFENSDFVDLAEPIPSQKLKAVPCKKAWWARICAAISGQP